MAKGRNKKSTNNEVNEYPLLKPQNTNFVTEVNKEDQNTGSVSQDDIEYNAKYWEEQQAFYAQNKQKPHTAKEENNDAIISWLWRGQKYIYKEGYGDIRQLTPDEKYYGVVSYKLQKTLDPTILNRMEQSLDIGIVSQDDKNGVVFHLHNAHPKLKIANEDIRLLPTILINPAQKVLYLFDTEASHNKVNRSSTINHQYIEVPFAIIPTEFAGDSFVEFDSLQ